MIIFICFAFLRYNKAFSYYYLISMFDYVYNILRNFNMKFEHLKVINDLDKIAVSILKIVKLAQVFGNF